MTIHIQNMLIEYNKEYYSWNAPICIKNKKVWIVIFEVMLCYVCVCLVKDNFESLENK